MIQFREDLGRVLKDALLYETEVRSIHLPRSFILDVIEGGDHAIVDS